MAFHSVTPPLSPKILRQFGWLLTFIFIVVCGIGIPFFSHQPTTLWPWAIGSITLILTLIKPHLLKIIYLPWMKLGHVLGWINTRIILGLFFFLIITPFAIGMRILKKDPMTRQFDSNLKSYRKEMKPQPITHMEKPFSC